MVCLSLHGLKIPQNAVSFEDFEEQMQSSEIEFKDVFI